MARELRQKSSTPVSRTGNRLIESDCADISNGDFPRARLKRNGLHREPGTELTGQSKTRTRTAHRIADVIPATDDPNYLWAWLEQRLADIAGINGIFYMAFPVGDSGGNLAELLERSIWKVTYPQAWLDSLTGNALSQDRTSTVVLETGEPCFWHHPETRIGATPGQLARMDLDATLGMRVGICIPIHSSTGRLSGGFGLRHKDQDATAFDRAVFAELDRLTELLHEFDRVFRGPYASKVIF